MKSVSFNDSEGKNGSNNNKNFILFNNQTSNCNQIIKIVNNETQQGPTPQTGVVSNLNNNCNNTINSYRKNSSLGGGSSQIAKQDFSLNKFKKSNCSPQGNLSIKEINIKTYKSDTYFQNNNSPKSISNENNPIINLVDSQSQVNKKPVLISNSTSSSNIQSKSHKQNKSIDKFVKTVAASINQNQNVNMNINVSVSKESTTNQSLFGMSNGILYKNPLAISTEDGKIKKNLMKISPKNKIDNENKENKEKKEKKEENNTVNNELKSISKHAKTTTNKNKNMNINTILEIDVNKYLKMNYNSNRVNNIINPNHIISTNLNNLNTKVSKSNKLFSSSTKNQSSNYKNTNLINQVTLSIGNNHKQSFDNNSSSKIVNQCFNNTNSINSANTQEENEEDDKYCQVNINILKYNTFNNLSLTYIRISTEEKDKISCDISKESHILKSLQSFKEIINKDFSIEKIHTLYKINPCIRLINDLKTSLSFIDSQLKIDKSIPKENVSMHIIDSNMINSKERIEIVENINDFFNKDQDNIEKIYSEISETINMNSNTRSRKYNYIFDFIKLIIKDSHNIIVNHTPITKHRKERKIYNENLNFNKSNEEFDIQLHNISKDLAKLDNTDRLSSLCLSNKNSFFIKNPENDINFNIGSILNEVNNEKSVHRSSKRLSYKNKIPNNQVNNNDYLDKMQMISSTILETIQNDSIRLMDINKEALKNFIDESISVIENISNDFSCYNFEKDFSKLISKRYSENFSVTDPSVLDINPTEYKQNKKIKTISKEEEIIQKRIKKRSNMNKEKDKEKEENNELDVTVENYPQLDNKNYNKYTKVINNLDKIKQLTVSINTNMDMNKNKNKALEKEKGKGEVLLNKLKASVNIEKVGTINSNSNTGALTNSINNPNLRFVSKGISQKELEKVNDKENKEGKCIIF